MKKRKRNSKSSIKERLLVRDIAGVWKFLVIFNLLMSVFGFWMIYSQNNYIMDSIEQNLPVAVPAYYKGTSVVVNPFTGQFVSVNSFTLVGTLIAIMLLLGVHFVLKETL